MSTSPYDFANVLQGPNLDARLFDYWTECQLLRTRKEINADQFEACMEVNAECPELPFPTRMKILKFTGLRRTA